MSLTSSDNWDSTLQCSTAAPPSMHLFDNIYPDFRPHDYQIKAIEHALSNPKTALFLEMGLGKTLCAGIVMDTLIRNADVKKILVVGTVRIINQTWPDEFRKWSFLNLDYTIVSGAPAIRLQQLSEDKDVYLISYENLLWLIRYYGKDWPFDMVVFDEASKIRDHRSKRHKAFRKLLNNINRILLLTGTPINGTLLSLWGLIYLLDQGQRLGRSFEHYKSRYFDQADYMGYRWTLKPAAQHEIENNINDLCLSMQAEDYLQMPDYISNVISCELPEASNRQYRELEKDMLLQLSKTQAISAANAAVLTGKCHQLANGFLYTDNLTVELHQAKLDALDDIIAEAEGYPVLCFYHFEADREMILKRFPKAQIMDKQGAMLKAWNRGEVQLLLAHPASAGHGLNMQDGGNIIVWYGLTWSIENYQQANARLYRQGQTRPVFIHHIVTRNTIDEQIQQALQEKRQVQDVLMSALKEKP